MTEQGERIGKGVTRLPDGRVDVDLTHYPVARKIVNDVARRIARKEAEAKRNDNRQSA